MMGQEVKKTAELYIGEANIFVGQISDGEFIAFDIKAGPVLTIVRMWNNLKVIDKPINFIDGSTVFIKPDFDKRPETGAAFSPLMLFGAIGGVIAGATAEKTPNPGSYVVVDAATAMKEIQGLHMASITPEARALVQQEIPSPQPVTSAH